MVGGFDGEEEKGGQVMMMMMHGDEETDRCFVRRESKVFSASYGLMGWCIADSSPQRIAWHLLRGIQVTAMQIDVLPIAKRNEIFFFHTYWCFLQVTYPMRRRPF